jgi:hypothetical protein
VSFIGKLIRPLRAGDKKLAIEDPAFAGTPGLAVSSDAFADGAPMPAPYVGADGVFPPLRWSGAPANTQSFALIVQDIDVPLPAPLVHAVAYGIAREAESLSAGAIPRAGSDEPVPSNLVIGRGVAGNAYAPPTPIPGHGPHHYVFQVFALDAPLDFVESPGESDLLKAMHGHVLACGAVTGTHEA